MLVDDFGLKFAVQRMYPRFLSCFCDGQAHQGRWYAKAYHGNFGEFISAK